MAWFRRKPGADVLFHSDRDSQYASWAMTAKLAEYGMTASMSRKGDCRDNAPTESFFNSLQNERVHGATYTTRADAQADLFECIEVFYNRRRRHSTLDYSSPVRSCRTGSASMSISNPRRHGSDPLEGEIRWAPHHGPPSVFGLN